MQCKCGYNYREHILDEPRPFNSYAVIHDRDYQKFLKSEMRLVRSKGEKKKLSALAQSAQYVGSLYKCPACSRFLLMRMDDAEMQKELLAREE